MVACRDAPCARKIGQPRRAFLPEAVRPRGPGVLGFRGRGDPITKVVLGLGSPLLAAVVWGTFVAPKAAIPSSMPLRLLPEALWVGAGEVDSVDFAREHDRGFVRAALAQRD